MRSSVGTAMPGLTALWSLVFSLVAVGSFLFLLIFFAWHSLPVWRHEGWSYVTSGIWFFRRDQYGALSMIYGTVAVALVAIVVAGPLGLGAAIFGSEFLSPRWRLPLKATIELLAGIPSVVYGLLGILLLRDVVYGLLTPLDPLSGDTLLTGGLLLGVMVLPTAATLADDALQAVSVDQRLAGRGLGLTATETTISVVLPQARAGLVSAVLLALGRALGETIAVFMVVGRQDNQLPESWFSPRPLMEAGQTLTTKLGGSETHLAYGDALHWAAMMGLGGLLLLVTLGATGAGLFCRRRTVA